MELTWRHFSQGHVMGWCVKSDYGHWAGLNNFSHSTAVVAQLALAQLASDATSRSGFVFQYIHSLQTDSAGQAEKIKRTQAGGCQVSSAC